MANPAAPPERSAAGFAHAPLQCIASRQRTTGRWIVTMLVVFTFGGVIGEFFGDAPWAGEVGPIGGALITARGLAVTLPLNLRKPAVMSFDGGWAGAPPSPAPRYTLPIEAWRQLVHGLGLGAHLRAR